MLRSNLGMLVVLTLALASSARAGEGNRLAYLDAFCDPYYVGRDFPKLTTPQWVGEEGVEAVVVLSIDDMRGHEKWETYLRPILQRLKKIDGRAPVSIFTCTIDPGEGHLQKWVDEGLSIEVHTIDHPCPCLQGSDFAQAAKTYHDCVDLMAAIDRSHPVAFRMPCCDSRNTPSPRFWTEIFNTTSAKGNFLRIDSSVFNIITPQDESLPRDITTDADGKPRFRRYIPFPSFVNTIEDYPYPYVIGRLCWQFPCVVPSDWSAQHVQRPNNPTTVADMQRALDAAVLKQGVFTLVFHPHGWMRNDQIVELIDYAEKKYGRRVKFMNLRECAERLQESLLAGQTLRDDDGGDNGVRVLDLNHDGFQDVVIGNPQTRKTRLWLPKEKRWRELDFPTEVIAGEGDDRAATGVRFGVVDENGWAMMLVKNDRLAGAWRFSEAGWKEDKRLLRGLKIIDREVFTSRGGVDQGIRLRDLDGDGRCELIAGGPEWQGVFRWDESAGSWRSLPFTLPANTFVVDQHGRDAGLRFVDVDADGKDDVIFSDTDRWSAHLLTSLDKGWSKGAAAQRSAEDLIPPIVRGATNNGAWFHSDHLWVQNEDTHRLPDGVARLSLAKLRARIEQPAADSQEDESDGQPKPRSPKEALQSFKTRPGLEIQLAAAEPLVVDPVAFDWGPDGRLWVVEMRDYPNGLDGKGKPGGRVKVLVDADDDGRYDRATVFLDELPFPTGVKVWRDGVLITAAPRILFAKDTDNDGRADEVETLYEGFGEGNQQHRVNGLRWGLDNWLYVGNGDSGGTIRSLVTDEKVDVRSRDLRIRPDTGQLQAISGNTQYGIDRDDWGNWFGGNNSHPAWHYVLDDVYLRRNPHFAPPAVKREISTSPGAARVFPISKTLERFNNPHSANHFTSACSPTIYRDRWLGAGYYGNIFVCEPVHNLVHREIVQPQGATFASGRADDERESEFLVSSDSWFRPAMIRTGPDGALWVADMYRLVIEHPKWIPEHFLKAYDVRAGDDRGRIYRIVRQGEAPRLPRLDGLSSDALVAKLADRNGSVRDLAQQMLLWRDDARAIDPLEAMALEGESPLGRLHALCTLDGLNKLRPRIVTRALNDDHSGVRRHAVRVSTRLVNQAPSLPPLLEKLTDDPDPHVRLQLAYAAGQWNDHAAAGRVIARLLISSDDAYQQAAATSSLDGENIADVVASLLSDEQQPPEELIGNFLAQAAAFGAGDAMLLASKRILHADEAGAFEVRQLRAADRLLEQLTSQAADKKVADQLTDELSPMLAQARLMVGEKETAAEARVAALALLRWADATQQPDDDELLALVQTAHPLDVQLAAIRLLVAQQDSDALQHVFALWKQFTPSLRGELLDLTLSHAAKTDSLLDAVAKKTIPASHLSAARRRRLLEHSDETIRRRAMVLLDAANVSTRAEVIERYQSALERNGDADRGRPLFVKHCSACHRLEDTGHHVGPDLAVLSDRSTPALLTAMLDPNRAVEDKYLSYTAVTNEGRIVNGMLVAEAGQSLTLRTAEGKSIVLLRNRLDKLRSSEKSFMPEGLEQDLKPAEVADLISYIQSAAAPPKLFAGNRAEVARPDDAGVVHLRASAARIYGGDLIFEQKYKNLGYWHTQDDHAVWSLADVPEGDYTIEFDYACDDSVAGDTFQLLIGGKQITGKVAATGTWDNYRWKEIGRVRLNEQSQSAVMRSLGSIRGALIDLRTIRLTPVR